MQEVLLQNCSRCKKALPVESFIGANGKPKKTCPKCRENSKKIGNKRHREKNRGKIVTDPGKHQCKSCLVVKSVDKFKVKDDGSLTACVGCLEGSARGRKKVKAENPEKLQQYEATKYKKIKTDPVRWRKELDRLTAYQKSISGTPLRKYHGLRNGASRRGIRVEISVADAEKLYAMECFYCGTTDEDRGIDRMDNTKGYVEGNVCACCSMCNVFKSDWSLASFIGLASHISAFNGLRGMLRTGFLPPKGRPSKYTTMQFHCKKNGRILELTKQDYAILRQMPCYLCGRSDGPNGVDRVDSSVGYTHENCKPCCAICNRAKMDSSHASFLSRCQAIYDRHKHLITDDQMVRAKRI